MEARLTISDADGRSRSFPIGGHPLVVGRDPACGLPIDSELVSWQHASIELRGSEALLTDLGSTNGTFLNGRPVQGSVRLDDGDLISFAEELTAVFEGPTAGGSVSARTRPLALGALAIVTVALIGVGLTWLLLRADPSEAALGEAVALARQGIEAARDGDQIAARDALREAAGQLYTAGLLDDVPTGDIQRRAMQMLQNELDVSFDLWAYYDVVLRQARTPRPSREAEVDAASRRCRLAAVSPKQMEPCLREWIDHVLVEMRQDTESVPDDFHESVGRRLRIENGFLRSSIERGRPLVPMLRNALEEAKMPPLLHYVALIESGYRNGATSTARAAGIWQFVPGTAKQYGLRVDSRVDERRDPEKATRAAARYLRDLAFEFGGDALLLALAGYNRGENGVRRALKRLDDPFSDRSYWRLVERDLLPDETQDYVPRFIAAAVAGEGGLPSPETLETAGY